MDVTHPGAVGDCFTCRWMRTAGSRRGAVFFRCARAETDPRYPKYPILPRRACPGYEDAMLFVVLMHYTKPLAEVDAVRAEHRRHLEEWAARGAVQAWSRRDPPTAGVIICAAPDRASVERMVEQDPYVRAGVATPEIVEFRSEDVRGTLRV